MRSFVEEPPDARSLGASDDSQLSFEVGSRMGEILRGLGVHINFAPVLDLDEFSDHPALKQRCFHKDPQVVGDHGAALIRGLHSAGVTACGKHFPGHGSAHLDSHVVLPESPRTLNGLEDKDLRAYDAPIAAGLELIMTAHVRFSAISELPSTCNPDLLTGILRKKMGYTGAVITDDLDMEGFRAIGPIRSTVQQALLAGADILLCCRDPEVQGEALAGLSDLYHSSSEGRVRVEDAAKRALTVYRSAHQRSQVGST
jgi:beta-N-acetylhexosaminidase